MCRELEHAAVAVLEAAADSELAHCDCVFAGQCAEGFYVVAVEVEQVLPMTHGEAFCWEMNGEFQNVRMDLVVLLEVVMFNESLKCCCRGCEVADSDWERTRAHSFAL